MENFFRLLIHKYFVMQILIDFIINIDKATNIIILTVAPQLIVIIYYIRQ